MQREDKNDLSPLGTESPVSTFGTLVCHHISISQRKLSQTCALPLSNFQTKKPRPLPLREIQFNFRIIKNHLTREFRSQTESGKLLKEASPLKNFTETTPKMES
jgi:hypothetical protein